MNDDLISRQTAIDDIETVNPSMPLNVNWVKNWVKTLPPAQPELIERTAYIRGFEQGRTQGMIDSQGGKNMIKAEWTNADALNLQQTCNQLATDCISRQAAINAVNTALFPKINTAKDAEKALRELPSAQPERKKGKWIVHPEVKNVYGGTYIECSQCGEKYVVQHMEDEKYCRNCGAKMEE